MRGERKLTAKRKRKKTNKKRNAVFIILICIVLTAVFALNHALRMKLRDIAVYKCKNSATDMINRSIQNTLDDLDYTYSDLVEINKNSENEITSVSCVSSKINSLKTNISNEINKDFENQDKNGFSIAVGTISGINLFSGVGPDITVHFEKEGSVKTNIKSSFSSAGINQTLHRIYIEVSSDIVAVAAAGTYKSSVETEFLLAETVIVGEIPERYASIS